MVLETPSKKKKTTKNPSQKGAGGVSQGIGNEFKSQL
jgi:hypothetical protein